MELERTGRIRRWWWWHCQGGLVSHCSPFALSVLPQLLVHDGVDGSDGSVLLLEQKKSQLGLEKHQ